MIESDKIKVTNENYRGGSLMTCVDVAYAVLVDLFGEPNCKTDGYKVDAEWIVEFMGVPFSIYNYKTGKNYIGDLEGLDVEFIRDWHIGGYNKALATEFVQFIKDNTNPDLDKDPVYDDKCLENLFKRIRNAPDEVKFKIEDYVENIA